VVEEAEDHLRSGTLAKEPVNLLEESYNQSGGAPDTCSSEEKLVFLHIPKNAGTAIEDAGDSYGVKWGRYMDFGACDLGFNDCKASWHQPPAKILRSNMYTQGRVFCVVRDPYARAVSEYKYLVANPEYRGAFRQIIEQEGCSATGLNTMLDQALTLFKSSASQHEAINLCHMIPQSYYVWGAPDADGRRCQWCHEVLHHEQLPESFNDLMERFNMDVRLPHSHVNEGSCANLTVNDLSSSVRDLLTDVYQDDLALLGYDAKPGTATTNTTNSTRNATNITLTS
jgi:hypothetical protein